MTESAKKFLTKYNYNESDIEIDFFQLGDLLDEFAAIKVRKIESKYNELLKQVQQYKKLTND